MKWLRGALKGLLRALGEPPPPEPEKKAGPNGPVVTDAAWQAFAGRRRPQAGKFDLIPMKAPPGVVPEGEPEMAMDQQVVAVAQWAQQAYNSAFAEGVTWLGYAYLSELAQRPEYRRITETIATEMTRKGIKLEASGEEDKTEQIRQLNEELRRLDLMGVLRRAMQHDGFFGRAHIYVDTGDTDDLDELKKSIGDGWDFTSETKIGVGKLKRLANVEPIWVYPTQYDSVNPLKPDWYSPTTWFVMGTEVNATRLIRIVSREVPDILKPAYMFGGLSMSQMAKPYVDNWLRTRQSVSDIISAFSVFVLKTNLSESLQLGGDALFKRAELFNIVRDNRGLMMLDKDSEDFANISASLASLDVLQAQSQEHMAAVSGIPIVKLLGIHPAGLNASEEGDLRSFYDWILACQEACLTPVVRVLVGFAMLNIWGKVDPDITASWELLWGLTEKEEAEVEKSRADTGSILLNGGVISPEEERRRVAADEHGPYAALDLDPEAMPEPPQQPGMMPENDNEEEGDEPGHAGDPREDRLEGRGQPKDPREERQDRMFPADVDRDERGRGPKKPTRDDRRQARDSAFHEIVEGFVHIGGDIWLALDDSGFKESDHPRDDDGKFATSGGGGKPKPKKQIIKEMLEKGTTAAELAKATGWPSVSVPWQAKQLGMGFIKYKEDGVTKYKFVPKEGEKAKSAPLPKPEPAKPDPEVAKADAFAMANNGKVVAAVNGYQGKILGAAGANIVVMWADGKTMKATVDEVEALMKNAEALAAGKSDIEKFTPKFAEALKKLPGMGFKPDTLDMAKEKIKAAVQSGDASAHAAETSLTTHEKNLIDQQYGSVEAAYKKGQGYHTAKQAQAKQQAEYAEQQKKAQEEYKKQQEAAKAAAAKAKADAAEKNKQAMKDLGITEAEAEGFMALVQMVGPSKYNDLVADFKYSEQQAAKYNYPVTGFEYALIQSYVDGNYEDVNEALRKGVLSPQEHAYVRMLNGALEKMPKYTGDDLERGTNLTASQFAEYVPGKIIELRGFTSSGVNFKFTNKNTFYKIKAIGQRGADFSKGANPSEREVLFKAHTFFLVNKVEQKNGKNYIWMEEVPGHG